jgi:AraC-like DNA-binding protein
MRGCVAARKILVVLAVAERAGLERAAVLQGIGLTSGALADPDAWIPQETWRAVWQLVVEQTGNEALGLEAAQQIDAGYFGVIDYAVRSCARVGEAIPVAARYFRLANTWGRIEVEQTTEVVRVSRRILGDEALWLPRQAAEFALAVMVRLFRSAARSLPLSQVTLRYPPPRDETQHRALFACPIRYGQPVDAIELPLEALSIPMRAPDVRLRALVEDHGANLLAQIEAAETSASVRVRQLVAPRLSQGPPEIEAAARALGTSRRTLQRQLAREGTSYREVVDTLRDELARAWLTSGLSPGEVAFLLGFSEVSAFHRAFCRWTGSPPGAWRSGSNGWRSGSRTAP